MESCTQGNWANISELKNSGYCLPTKYPEYLICVMYQQHLKYGSLGLVGQVVNYQNKTVACAVDMGSIHSFECINQLKYNKNLLYLH
jgi:hypothetical protein